MGRKTRKRTISPLVAVDVLRMKPLIGLSTDQEGDRTEQQHAKCDGQRGCTVAVVFVASAHLLATTESGTLIALALVGRLVIAAFANNSGVWRKVVHWELDDLNDLAAIFVFESCLVFGTVNGHRFWWDIVCAAGIVRTVALEATDGIALADEDRNQQ